MSESPEPPEPSNPLLALSGTVLESRYELGRVLGAGGMGAVFEAKHLRLDRTVAIKVLRPVFVGHDEYIKRFLREAKVASRIRHRNVVEILDFGEAAGGLVYSVMELLRGQDLHQLLKAQAGKRLPWPQACSLLLQVASGLKAAHAAGIVHRDIKPANCFVTTDDEGHALVKLVDFGIAKVDEADQSQKLTGTAEVLGTPAYIAPELMLTKSPASPASDIYSLGVLAYRMLTGRVPFSGETSFQVLHNACFEPVPPLSDFVPDVPPAVEAFVLEMLAKRPDERPPDMQAVRDTLIALGRETLGAEAVEIPASSALMLGPIDGSGSYGPSELPTLPRGATPPSTMRAPRASAAQPATTKVSGASLPRGTGVLAPLPDQALPSVIVGAPAAPQLPLFDPGSRPLAHVSSPTLPSLKESTLPLQDTASVVRRQGGGRRVWLGAGGLAALLGIGVVGMQMMNTTTEPAVEAEPVARMVDAAPKVVAPLEVPATPADTPEPAAAPAAGVAPTPEPQPDPQDGEVLLDSTPAPEPEPERQPTKASDKPAPAKPRGPASDATLRKQLMREIKKACDATMAGQPLAISFIITPEGKSMAFNATPRAAATCAAGPVKRMTFRPRSSNEPMNFTVK